MNRASLARNEGQAMLTAVVFFMLIALAVVAGTAPPALDALSLSQDASSSAQSYFTSESALEDVIVRAEKGKPYPSPDTIQIDNQTGVATIVHSSGVPASLTLTASSTVEGEVRRVSVSLTQGVGMDFQYGIQVGDGGLVLNNNSVLNGNAYANGSITGSGTITGSAITGGTIASGVTVQGTKTTGAPALSFPPLDIPYWESLATTIENGDQSVNGSNNSLGNTKVVGNLTLSNNAQLKLTGPVYVTGNFTLDNNATLSLDPSLDAQGTVMVVDGNIVFDNGSKALASNASPKAYILLVSNAQTDNAITLDNNASSSILYVPNGGVEVDNNAKAVSITAQKVTLDNNAVINYDLGIVNANFSSGPSGGWRIGSWQEVP